MLIKRCCLVVYAPNRGYNQTQFFLKLTCSYSKCFSEKLKTKSPRFYVKKKRKFWLQSFKLRKSCHNLCELVAIMQEKSNFSNCLLVFEISRQCKNRRCIVYLHMLSILLQMINFTCNPNKRRKQVY